MSRRKSRAAVYSEGSYDEEFYDESCKTTKYCFGKSKRLLHAALRKEMCVPSLKQVELEDVPLIYFIKDPGLREELQSPMTDSKNSESVQLKSSDNCDDSPKVPSYLFEINKRLSHTAWQEKMFVKARNQVELKNVPHNYFMEASILRKIMQQSIPDTANNESSRAENSDELHSSSQLLGSPRKSFAFYLVKILLFFFITSVTFLYLNFLPSTEVRDE